MVRTQTIEDHLARLEIEDLFWYEADLLDEHRYEEWLDLFTEDVRYWMPIRQNVPGKKMETELTDESVGMSWFNNDKVSLERRVKQIQTGVHWADEPLSRVSHIVSNVRILEWNERDEVKVKCRFIFYRNRHLSEE